MKILQTMGRGVAYIMAYTELSTDWSCFTSIHRINCHRRASVVEAGKAISNGDVKQDIISDELKVNSPSISLAARS